MSTKSKRNKKDVKTENTLFEKFKELEGNSIGHEKVTRVNIGDADIEYSCLFGANKNLYRAICSLTDGLKPGKRRLFYSWWELEHRPQDTSKETLNRLKSIKVDKLSANTVNYHPHGTVATDDIIGREGQYWNNNVMTIIPQGSYGNIRSDPPAAGRYREAKMSEYMIDCFFDDFDKYCVPMKLGYDGENYEPEFLPAKYPNVLFNPQFSGMGYGVASNIPGFNVSEVLDATITLIKNPKAHILLIPDSPTGCDIVDEGNFEEINKTGQSKITFRATAEIDYKNNIISITSLPLNSTSMDVISSILSLREKGGFEEIQEIKDYTKEGEVKLDIYLKNTAKPEKVLQQLYKKKTGLKVTFPVGITVIDDYVPYDFGVRDLLLEWISYRVDIVRSMFLNNLQTVLSKQHMNEVLLLVFNKNNIDTTIQIAKTSKTRKETIERFMKQFKITSLQAGVIADMRVYNFNEDSYLRYKEEREKLASEVKYINEVLNDDKKIDEFIISQLRDGKRKYGRPRKSKIIKENEGEKENIPDTEHLIGITESGYIKKVLLTESQNIGMIGKGNSNLTVLQVNNRENILIVDSEGYVTKVSISAIPNMEYEDIGVEINRFFSIRGTIKSILELPSMEILKVKDNNFGIIFFTKLGYTKTVPLHAFKKLSSTKRGITLSKGDEIASAIFTLDSTIKDLVVATNLGRGMRLKMSDIRELSPNAKGNNLIKLKDNEFIVNVSKINPKKKLLLYVTSQGRLKLTELKYFPPMKKNEDLIVLIPLNPTDSLIGVVSVERGDIIDIYKKHGNPERIEIDTIEISARISKAKKIITLQRGDSIVAYKLFSK